MWRKDQEISAVNYNSGSFGALLGFYSTNAYALWDSSCVKTL